MTAVAVVSRIVKVKAINFARSACGYLEGGLRI